MTSPESEGRLPDGQVRRLTSDPGPPDFEAYMHEVVERFERPADGVPDRGRSTPVTHQWFPRVRDLASEATVGLTYVAQHLDGIARATADWQREVARLTQERDDPTPPASTRVDTPARIAIVSTPRSGTTWLRFLLERLYGVPSIEVHDPSDIPWSSLPSGLVVSIHWRPTPAFLAQLDHHGFQPVVLARHPLDILISILQFSLRDPSTANWLAGEGGSERPIFAAMPRSSAFINYATGPRARALFSVTHEWRAEPRAIKLRYEDMVAAPAAEMRGLVEAFDWPLAATIEAALDATTIPELRRLTSSAHRFWIGKPGTWRRLLPRAEASRIALELEPYLASWGYECDADPTLTGEQADATWVALMYESFGRDLHGLPAERWAAVENRARLDATESSRALADWCLDRIAIHLRELGMASTEAPSR